MRLITSVDSTSGRTGERVLNIPEVTEDLSKVYSDKSLDPSEITPKAKWTATASSEKSWGKIEKIIDGDKTNCWHTNYDEADGKITHKDPPPYEFTVNFNEETEFSGLRFYVRKNNYSGYFNQAEIYVSDDGTNFTKAGERKFDADTNIGAGTIVERTIFTSTDSASARYVKICVSTSQSWIFIDEVMIIAE